MFARTRRVDENDTEDVSVVSNEPPSDFEGKYATK